MTRFQVDSEAVAAATANVRATIGRIQGEVGAMSAQLADLQGSWSGSAATAFQGVVAEWRTTQQRVEESLSGVATALDHAGRQYAEIEQANARMFLR